MKPLFMLCGSRFAVWLGFLAFGVYLTKCEGSWLVKNWDYSLSNTSRIRREASCDPTQFQCNHTRECISAEKICDGHEDCKDGSDEFQVLCKSKWCPGYLFRCKYGACIDANKKCNGIEDCKDASDEENCPDTTSNKIDTNCRSDEFECKNGQCISLDNKCDGVTNCNDKSDETSELCQNTYCPRYLFRCAYGACVNGNSNCNGIKDCLDGSDEADCPPTVPVSKPPPVTGTPSPPITSGGCTTPNQPSYGKWEYVSNTPLAPAVGISVPSSTFIKFSCEKDYQLLTENNDRKDKAIVYCDQGQWSMTQMPTCHRRCRPYYNTHTTILKCTDLITKIPVPCDRATENTTLEYSCAPYYERPYGDSPIRYCQDGTWNFRRPECVQVCGQKHVSVEPLIVKGKEVKRGNYPWVAAIYQKQSDGSYINVCGGSVLTERVVLTAAHCVTADSGQALDPSIYIISSGKYYNNYKDTRDTEAQYAEVESFNIPAFYKANTNNYIADIAVVVLKEPFALSKVVQPVCFNIENFDLTYNTLGIITGWGYTKAGGTPSDVLKELEVPYRNENDCKRELPTDFANLYVQPDKICAGYFQKGTSVCKGDSGGGLVFPDQRGRFNIFGVVSVGHKLDETNCNIQQSALFTKVTTYLEWIKIIVFRYIVRSPER